MFRRYVAIGDSFTEGVGDWFDNGEPRGWADRVAEALALRARLEDPDASPATPFEYANLAVRGRKLPQVAAEQVVPAIRQKPDIISINAGGNDMLRPGYDNELAVKLLLGAVEQVRASDIHVLLLAGPDPSANLPLGRVFSQRGELFTTAVAKRVENLENLTLVDNFHDDAFQDTTYWSEDGLHLSTAGHLRVAANVLDGLGVEYPEQWGDPHSPIPELKSFRSARYFNSYVMPWIGRRLTGRSSGDGRAPKRPNLSPL